MDKTGTIWMGVEVASVRPKRVCGRGVEVLGGSDGAAVDVGMDVVGYLLVRCLLCMAVNLARRLPGTR
jgi:hypothetical protein